jgi:hypothetical protein
MLTLFLLEQVPLSSHPALLKAFAGTRGTLARKGLGET